MYIIYVYTYIYIYIQRMCGRQAMVIGLLLWIYVLYRAYMDSDEHTGVLKST